MYKCAVILAAGEGKRMKSDKPKVLHKVCGKEMVNHVIDTMRAADLEEVNVIVGKGAEEVKAETESRKVSYSLQDKQLGTGHAVMCTKDFLQGKKGVVAVFTGDAPLIREETVRKLINFQEEGNYSAVILTSIVDNPKGYGRVIREGNSVGRIVEDKDCSSEEAKVNEINAGMYAFDIENLLESLDKLTNNNAQGEYYLTDVIGILKQEGKAVGALVIDFEETLGVNSRVELSQAERIMRERINNKHMNNGVTIIDPLNTYIDSDVEIEKDVLIYPGNVLQGKTVIKSGVVLYPNNRIENSIIGEGTVVQSSVILESTIGENTTVGPYAYIRPESHIGSNVRIGDFVEIKKSTIGDKTKVSHLTYIGDAEVGSNCNFGCGTVVVNYDGRKKYKTKIGDNVFIGCNTNLVAPVELKDNSYTAAGSTITEEVPEGSLAIARAKQINKEGWVKRRNSNK
ncbi:MAG: bifunctional UDP-N-acetylglucosamine diphosphorylase/glucosamine-1-phosphate N-acetyltransferase GlmU [Clostridiales bacterium]|uniref:bifunctional UDP-N-acetylglucosamine diphosphorylase/glucosamine-1-phosphate N-acetyltransferase GlmU n=1 Tax=Clostridium sp. N3C TaxID=1776758 RepID=UPI00092DED39|nr:bifunctional UDP-N-acetylglucosamine diphosphorylase/glucosamine-1-phosphate N-acetyltransferase GlmU [Clostridium sp. N3C]NLZ48357.1 bifunctional UDP-N-acetylglucosamine diphosphorylase/glucosamine-1-phosphate N-acetyltransferase GlmU [Clostridiales bacterium]SCN23107.1 Bifunctional protein GlmU [Clostridium sp. N3C]